MLRKVSQPATEKAVADLAPVLERNLKKVTVVPPQSKENGVPAANPEPLRRPPFEPPKKQPEVVQKPPIPGIRRPSETTIPIERVESKPVEKPVDRPTSKPRVLERTSSTNKYEGLPGPPKPPAPPMPPAPPPPPPGLGQPVGK